MAAYAGELEEEEQSGSLCARGVCEPEVAMQGGLMFVRRTFSVLVRVRGSSARTVVT